MKILNGTQLASIYENFQCTEISSRRLIFDDIYPLIKKLRNKFSVTEIGQSENGIPIYSVKIGSGPKKVLTWSQMHGNESTGTKAVFDLFNFFTAADSFIAPISETILKNCTLEFIIMLNPDGAVSFTRENANGIDLNRDAVDRKAVESRLLRDRLERFNPDFCFNLHDQRSIFNVTGTSNPATLSFLAPSEEISRQLTPGRKKTMSVIVAMNRMLQELIPGHVGRYTDEFYPTATGDNFQKLGFSTILIEAGHAKNDYDRNLTRKYNCLALLQGLFFIATATDYGYYKPYFNIPNNDNKFLDAIYTNVSIDSPTGSIITEVGVQYVFKMIDGQFKMLRQVEQTGNLSSFHTYNVINAEKKTISELKLSNS